MKDRFAPLVILVLALLLPLAYVGSYAALYDPKGPLRMQDDGMCRRKFYRYGGRAADFLFAPLQMLDWRKG
jgi:hypothetical protein